MNKINYQIKSKSDWAPSLWNHLHLMGYNYPDSPTEIDKNKIKNKVFSLIDDIPCGECKSHATEYINKNPIETANKKKVFDWTVAFHNNVNKRLGKPVYDVVLNNDIKSNTISNNNNIMDPIGAKFNYQYAFDAIPQQDGSNTPFYQITQPELPPDPIETRRQYLNNALTPMNDGYKLISEFLGVSPEELNLIYTPNVINNIIQLLIDMNLTTFASFSVNVLGSLGLALGGILGKNNLSSGDKILLQEFTAWQLTNLTKYANAKVRNDVIEGAKKLFTTLSNITKGESSNVTKDLIDCFVETPSQYKEKRMLHNLLGTDVDDYIDESIAAFSTNTIPQTRAKQIASRNAFDRTHGVSSYNNGSPYGSTGYQNTKILTHDDLYNIDSEQELNDINLDEIPIPSNL